MTTFSTSGLIAFTFAVTGTALFTQGSLLCAPCLLVAGFYACRYLEVEPREQEIDNAYLREQHLQATVGFQKSRIAALEELIDDYQSQALKHESWRRNLRVN